MSNDSDTATDRTRPYEVASTSDQDVAPISIRPNQQLESDLRGLSKRHAP